MSDYEAGSIELWRRLVDDHLWAVGEPVATHAEAAQLYAAGLTPRLAAQRLVSNRDRQRDGDFGGINEPGGREK